MTTPLAPRQLELLRCPHTGAVLEPGYDPPRRAAGDLPGLLARLRAALPSAVPVLEWLGTSDGLRYPVLGGIPLLLLDYAHDADGPLRLRSGALDDDEVDFYNDVSFAEAADLTSSAPWRSIARAAAAPIGFPGDLDTWLDAPYDGPAQLRCYAHLAPVLPGGTVLQAGGKGTHAVKFLLAGARRAVLVSPVLGEVAVALACAQRAGVGAGLLPVVAVGERLPLGTGTVDGLFCGGTLHHMDAALAGREFGRVLADGGRLAAAEPWKVPVLHALGTRALGKREAVGCRPIDPRRLAALQAAFAGQISPRRHGALTRYPLLAMSKAGVVPQTGRLVRWQLLDDRVAAPLQGLGSSLSVIGTTSAPSARVDRELTRARTGESGSRSRSTDGWSERAERGVDVGSAT